MNIRVKERLGFSPTPLLITTVLKVYAFKTRSSKFKHQEKPKMSLHIDDKIYADLIKIIQENLQTVVYKNIFKNQFHFVLFDT